MATYTRYEMLAIGGREWQKGDKHRIYLPDGRAASYLDLSHKSNYGAGRVIDSIGPVYWNAADGEIYTAQGGDRFEEWMREAILDGIDTEINQLDRDAVNNPPGSDCNPLNLPIFNAQHFNPHPWRRHVDDEAAERDELAAAMSKHGWQGAPVVAIQQLAEVLCGNRKFLAARQAELSPIPAVDIFELLDAAGVSYTAYQEKHLAVLKERFRRSAYEFMHVIVAICMELPAEIRDAYGVDLDAIASMFGRGVADDVHSKQ